MIRPRAQSRTHQAVLLLTPVLLGSDSSHYGVYHIGEV
jgi:hypothetical protein